MSQKFILSLKEEISLVEDLNKGHLSLLLGDDRLIFYSIEPGMKMALHTLANGGANLEQISCWVQEDKQPFPLLKFYRHLQKLSHLGWICYSVSVESSPVATAVPIAVDHQFSSTEASSISRYILSRFAYIHRNEGILFLESPVSKMRVHLLDWRGLAILSLLGTAHTCLEIVAQIPNISLDTTKELVSLLANAQMLSEVSTDGIILEESNLSLVQWEFHDLLFHARSRIGRHTNPVGGTYRFLGKITPLPALKPQMSEEIVELYKPNLEALKETEVSFTQILETRRSIREYGEIPITAQQLGEFLYRTDRVKEIIQTTQGELAIRPYPCGGAFYELELYPVVDNCKDLASGLYHYSPQKHQLCLLSSMTESIDTLLKSAAWSIGQQNKPQILILIAARFQRVSWKYESIAYSVILKHVGVLYQTMYLVATAMNLAPCAIGSGDSDLFTQVTGCDYYFETSVGEFALGSRRKY